jgi:hypothetical protein
MADSQAHIKQVLHKLGYARTFRRMSGFSNFAISFSIICILAGGISAFPAAFNATKRRRFLLVCRRFICSVGIFSMGQIASAYQLLAAYTMGAGSSAKILGLDDRLVQPAWTGLRCLVGGCVFICSALLIVAGATPVYRHRLRLCINMLCDYCLITQALLIIMA